jgi:hypothetical protein
VRKPLLAGLRRSRILEWGLLVALLAVLIGVMQQQSHTLQAQAELAAVQSTLGALRTTLVLAHLQKTVASGQSTVVDIQHNPFKHVRSVPANYAGEMARSEIAQVSAGNWVFDTACVCIGYLPMYPESLAPRSEPAALWFRVDGAPGPLQITAEQAYLWLGQSVN